MTLRFFPNLAIIVLAATSLNLGAFDVQAQTLLKNAQSDRLPIQGVRGEESSKGTHKVQRSGKTLFPGDHFLKAVPGDHFTPQQERMLVNQGISSLADFMAADAATIGRVVNMPERSVIRWQQDIKNRMR